MSRLKMEYYKLDLIYGDEPITDLSENEDIINNQTINVNTDNEEVSWLLNNFKNVIMLDDHE